MKKFEQFCHEVAVKASLGATLVTGHKVTHFMEAAELYADQYRFLTERQALVLKQQHEKIAELKKIEEGYYKAIRDNAIYISLLKQVARKLSPLHDSKLLTEIKQRLDEDTI